MGEKHNEPFQLSFKNLANSACIAAVLFVGDAFMFNQGIIAPGVMIVCLLVFLPRALWSLRTNRQLFRLRLAKVGIYIFGAMAVFTVNALQNQMADRRAIMIGKDCLAFHAKYQRYPESLNELVPEFLRSVPPAKYTLWGAPFFYVSRPEGGEPILYYQALPPFGRRFYHMEKGYWGYLD
jgi:hypothetical protein